MSKIKKQDIIEWIEQGIKAGEKIQDKFKVLEKIYYFKYRAQGYNEADKDKAFKHFENEYFCELELEHPLGKTDKEDLIKLTKYKVLNYPIKYKPVQNSITAFYSNSIKRIIVYVI